MDRNEQRLTNLESTIMHLQNDYESLNQVVLETARRLDTMVKRMQQLTDQIAAANDPQPARRPEDEKPPHY